MALPRAVQEAAERAEALQRTYIERNTAEQATPDGKVAPAQTGGEAGAVASVTEAPVEIKVDTAAASQPQAQPTAVQPPQTPPQPAPAPAQPTAVDWEHKYRVLAGKYSAEVPELSQRIRDLQSQVDRLSKAPPPPDPIVTDMTPEQVVEKFGPEFAQAVAAIVVPMADARANRVREEVAPEISRVSEFAASTARGGYLSRLSALVPNWESIDSDPGFTAWLDSVDRLTGYPRRRFFSEADGRNDADRVSRFFIEYAGPQAAAAQPAQKVIEAQLAPPVSGAAPPMPAGKRVWREQEIKQFYADVRRGLITEQDARRIESDIFAAQRERRIAA